LNGTLVAVRQVSMTHTICSTLWAMRAYHPSDELKKQRIPALKETGDEFFQRMALHKKVGWLSG